MKGERIRELRKKRSMTQSALAELLGLEKSTIAKYESSDITPSSDILMKLADVFSVSADYLLGRTDSPHSEIDMALCSPVGYDKLSDEEKEQIDRLIEMFVKNK